MTTWLVLISGAICESTVFRSSPPALLQLVRCYETTNTECPQINWMNGDTVIAVSGAGYAPLLFWDMVHQSFRATVKIPQQTVGSDTDSSSNRLVVIDTSGRLAVYDSQGTLEQQIQIEPHAIPSAVRWSQDSTSILLAVEGGRLYQLPVTKDVPAKPTEVFQHASTVTAIGHGLEGSWYLGDFNGNVQQVDQHFRPIRSINLSNRPVRSIVETAEEPDILYVSVSEVLRVNLSRGTVTSVIDAQEHQHPVYLQPSGNRIICSGGNVSSFDLDQPTKIDTWLQCSSRQVADIAFDRTAERIAVCIGQSLAVTDSHGYLLFMHRFDEGGVESLSWSPDGRRLAAASGWGGKNFYLFQQQGETKTLQLAHRVRKPNCVVSVAWLDESTVGMAGESGVLHLWDTQTNAFVSSHSLGDFVRSFTVSPDRQRLAFGFQNDGLLVLDRNFKTVYSDSESFGSTAIRMTCWHRDNARLAVINSKKQVMLYDLETGLRDIHVPSPWSQPTCIAWTGQKSELEIAPLGRFIANEDGTLLEIQADRRARTVDWSADGRTRIATDQLSTLHYSQEGVLKWSLLFDQDGTAITVDAAGNTVSSWGATKEPVR